MHIYVYMCVCIITHMYLAIGTHSETFARVTQYQHTQLTCTITQHVIFDSYDS